ncbi:MAG TPA: 3-phosphoserine/phosphohydroxythreonine transaminase [Abditibacteriaceae bacterium]|jgi:phosphoserine aminotransferase
MPRVFNFSAGPAAMPLPVLEQVQRELVELPDAGMSIMEMSHRSARFESIIASAENGVRRLLGLSDDYHVLFLQGGASLQFSMVPMNLLNAGASADYILTDEWSQKALKEAQKVAGERGATVRTAGSTADEKFARIPRADEITIGDDARYAHFTSNNTLFGTEWQSEPETGTVPLVCDASSDILSRPLDVPRYGLIYAGAQKNLGPAGVTLVIVRDDFLGETPPALATMLNYRTHIKSKSLYNTPNTFGIYVLDLVCQWIESQGGLSGIEQKNIEKSNVLYNAIDATEFYRGHAAPDSRSRMNVTFRLPSEELEKQFIKEATAAGLDGLKGHRDVGGLRASLYNAFPREGVEALVGFMQEFEQKNG